MDERNNQLNGYIGTTGLIQYRQCFDISHFINPRNIRAYLMIELERMHEVLKQIMLKIIEDGRQYHFDYLGFETRNRDVPPFDFIIDTSIISGLVRCDDCRVGEYYYMTSGPHQQVGRLWGWNLDGGVSTFRYEGRNLWRRMS